jgi:(2S)-methylsuccinyl-CoA dehydrogenase
VRPCAAIAVTEPDFGSDVAGLNTMAIKTNGGWLINGTKTWCTFAARADVLMLLARTDPDRAQGSPRALALPGGEARGDSHGFLFAQDASAAERHDDGRLRVDPSTPWGTVACTPTS